MDELPGRYSHKTISQLRAISQYEVLLLAGAQIEKVGFATTSELPLTKEPKVAIESYRGTLKEWREANGLTHMPEVGLEEAQIMRLFKCRTQEELEGRLSKMKTLKLVWRWHKGRHRVYRLRMEPHEPIHKIANT
jgi:hypothetical protein